MCGALWENTRKCTQTELKFCGIIPCGMYTKKNGNLTCALCILLHVNTRKKYVNTKTVNPDYNSLLFFESGPTVLQSVPSVLEDIVGM
jgi:hypothetical protein